MPNPPDLSGRNTALVMRSLPEFAVGTGRQRGYVLVVSVLILVLITVISVSMARSFFLEEGMAGNLREKTRSFAAAQAALNYGETVAALGGPVISCSTTGAIAAQICSNAATSQTPSSTATPYTTYISVLNPSYLNVNQNGGTDTFYHAPGVYIQFMGFGPNAVPVYTITAFGYGGSLNSLSIVQSTYVVNPSFVSAVPSGSG